MFRYIIRRSLYSVLIVAGVLLLTFVLFNLAAGDPVAAVLGKNARPEELESMRRELGGDLPLLWGRRCRTESYPEYHREPADRPVAELNIAPIFRAREIGAEARFSDGSRRVFELDPGETLRVTAPGGAVIESVEFFRLQDNPANSQFLRSLAEVVSFRSEFPYVEFFNFGRTITTREPIREILWRGVWPSLALMLPIFLGELVVGLGLAVIAAANRNRWPDRLIVLLSVAGMSVSYVVVIIFAQWVFGYYLELFPLWGFDSVASLGLPILTGVLCGVGGNVRFYRTVFVDEMRREYLRTATAKGVSPGVLYGRHMLRNATIQIITRASATLPFLFTGSLLLESFFGIPGLGFAGVDALYNSDIQLLKALVVLSAILFVVINLLADLAYAWADPRIRLE